jgi:hypothetical protein
VIRTSSPPAARSRYSDRCCLSSRTPTSVMCLRYRSHVSTFVLVFDDSVPQDQTHDSTHPPLRANVFSAATCSSGCGCGSNTSLASGQVIDDRDVRNLMWLRDQLGHDLPDAAVITTEHARVVPGCVDTCLGSRPACLGRASCIRRA